MKTRKSTFVFSNILQHLHGLKKMEAYDILSRLEALLFYAPDPLRFENPTPEPVTEFQKDVVLDPFRFTLLPNGNLCEWVGCNSFIHIYKEHKLSLPRWLPKTYYFKTKYAPLELLKLTSSNLRESFLGRPEEKVISEFISQKRVTAKDKQSGQLLLLRLSGCIDS